MALLVAPEHADDYLDVLSLCKTNSKNTSDIVIELKEILVAADALLNQDFYKGHNITRLVQTRAWIIEQFVVELWGHFKLNETALALVAVGGFGRGDLQPKSDVDLLLLFEGQLPETYVSGFIQALWDLGLDVGHAVRTAEECYIQASKDVTVATNLMEGRFMVGRKNLFKSMRKMTKDDQIWPGKAFFKAKYEEQLRRHKKCGGTAYNLEPNIKEGPGGLRDIQMVTWVAQRHFHVSSMHGLVDVGFLKPYEYISLQKGMRKLWKIRFALHLLAERKEDRILFEHQKKLAEIFGFEDDENSLAVEKFMQNFYRNAMQLELLNMRLLQLFKENILQGHQKKQTLDLSENFRSVNSYLEIKGAHLFEEKPEVFFEIFQLHQRHPQLKGIRANTLRDISHNLHVIDQKFRDNKLIKAIFISVFKQEREVFRQLSLMNRLGILECYLPVFKKIVGRMQYDLFHMYTVDQHSLFVLRNIRLIYLSADQHSLAHEVMSRFDQPYVLYLAGFFHDIAKGRGGDHAELGAIDADAFAVQHGLPQTDKEMLVWLVRFHLVMSVVAQKQDISDPHVIEKFVALVDTQKKLDGLYVLTVADISGTDPKLWNSYKDSLISELYHRSSACLGSEQSIGHVSDSQSRALELLQASDQISIEKLWQGIPDRFFDFATASQIAQLTKAIGQNQYQATVCVTDKHADGFEIMVYGEDHKGLFYDVVHVFSANQINVADARIYSSKDGSKALDYFHCLGAYSEALLVKIELDILHALASRERVGKVMTKIPCRREKHFLIEPSLLFTLGRNKQETRIDIKCADEEGLLSTITEVLLNNNVDIHVAKIATFGNRAEDVFMVSYQGKALSQKLQDIIELELFQQLRV